VCRLIHIDRLTEAFEVKNGNKQGCMLSPFLFLLVINWITKQSIDSKGTGIRWISGKSPEDLEFADDLALLSHSVNHMQEKTHCLHPDHCKLSGIKNQQRQK